jgi:hypothetical protein
VLVGKSPHRFAWVRWVAWVLCVLCAPLVRAESEYAVKAAYLFNFTTLVKWPASAFASPQAPLVIGVVGLDGTLRGQKAGGRPIEVRHVGAGDGAALQSCHLVYVADSDRAGDVARAVQGRPVLVVGEGDDSARAGGGIGFVMRDRKIKIEINNGAIRLMRLTVSSDLLGIARIVN